MDSYQAWRAAVEGGPSGKPLKALTTTTHDGLAIEPIVALSAPAPALPSRFAIPRTGPVLRARSAAPEGPALAWWEGGGGIASSSTTTVVIESDEPPAAQLSALEVIIVGLRPHDGARLASKAALDAAEAGGGVIVELACALIDLAIALERGTKPAELAIALTVGGDFFVELAKLRAARFAIAGLLARTGHTERALPIATRQTWRSLSGIDIATNALRSSIAASAAMIGGASYVALRPHDGALLDRGAHPMAERLSWTAGEVLARESGLSLIDDAAQGAPLIESLTQQIGDAAWSLARTALAGDGDALGARIELDASARRAAFATRRSVLVGASRFLGDAEPAVDRDRDAQPFEALRKRGADHAGLVLAVGDRKLEPRIAFAQEVLALAGLDVKVLPRAEDVQRAIAAFGAEPAAPLVIVAVSDAALATDGVALVRAGKAAGAAVLIAGKPGEHHAILREAGACAFVHQGADILQQLGIALDAAAITPAIGGAS
jgi:methylmalonyl-CoA mutase